MTTDFLTGCRNSPLDCCIHSVFQILFPYTGKRKTPIRVDWGFFWRRRRDLNPRYPFGVYTISNRARSASYATSPFASALADFDIIHHEPKNVKHYFIFFKKFFIYFLTSKWVVQTSIYAKEKQA